MTWLLPSRSQPESFTRCVLLYFWKSNFVTCAGFQLPFCLDLPLVSDFDGSINPKKISFFKTKKQFFLFQIHFRPRLVTWLPPSRYQPESLTRGVPVIFESPTSLHAQVSNFRFLLIYTWSLIFDGSINPKKISFYSFSCFKLNFVLD